MKFVYITFRDAKLFCFRTSKCKEGPIRQTSLEDSASVSEFREPIPLHCVRNILKALCGFPTQAHHYVAQEDIVKYPCIEQAMDNGVYVKYDSMVTFPTEECPECTYAVRHTMKKQKAVPNSNRKSGQNFFIPAAGLWCNTAGEHTNTNLRITLNNSQEMYERLVSFFEGYFNCSFRPLYVADLVGKLGEVFMQPSRYAEYRKAWDAFAEENRGIAEKLLTPWCLLLSFRPKVAYGKEGEKIQHINFANKDEYEDALARCENDRWFAEGEEIQSIKFDQSNVMWKSRSKVLLEAREVKGQYTTLNGTLVIRTDDEQFIRKLMSNRIATVLDGGIVTSVSASFFEPCTDYQSEYHRILF